MTTNNEHKTNYLQPLSPRSTTSTCGPEAEIYKGVLYKRGKLNTSWKKRYFVLLNTRKLLYYRDEAAYQKNEKFINYVKLANVLSVRPVNDQKNQESVSKQFKRQKSRKKKRFSLDFAFLQPRSNVSTTNLADGEDSDDEEDGYIHFIELALNQQFTFELVTKKRRYLLCTNDAVMYNTWLTEIEGITFGKKLFKGWLNKRGDGVKTWKRRWFVIYDTQEMRYYEDQQRSQPKGAIFVYNIQTLVKVDEYTARKKYKKTEGALMELNLPERCWIVQCEDEEERQEWFIQIIRLMESVNFLIPVFEDFLFKWDDYNQTWHEKYYALDNKSLYEFNSEQEYDEYQSIAYFDHDEFADHYNQFVQFNIPLLPFTTKTVQKIRPGSRISTRLNREYVFIIHNSLGKFFFATHKQGQLNRWFKILRRMGARLSVSRARQNSLESDISQLSALPNTNTNTNDNTNLGKGASGAASPPTPQPLHTKSILAKEHAKIQRAMASTAGVSLPGPPVRRSLEKRAETPQAKGLTPGPPERKQPQMQRTQSTGFVMSSKEKKAKKKHKLSPDTKSRDRGKSAAELKRHKSRGRNKENKENKEAEPETVDDDFEKILAALQEFATEFSSLAEGVKYVRERWEIEKDFNKEQKQESEAEPEPEPEPEPEKRRKRRNDGKSKKRDKAHNDSDSESGSSDNARRRKKEKRRRRKEKEKEKEKRRKKKQKQKSNNLSLDLSESSITYDVSASDDESSSGSEHRHRKKKHRSRNKHGHHHSHKKKHKHKHKHKHKRRDSDGRSKKRSKSRNRSEIKQSRSHKHKSKHKKRKSESSASESSD